MGPKWLQLAYKELGVKEGVGKANNPTVVQYFAEAQHPEIKADEVPWCAAFVGAMLKRAGIKSSESLAARSYEKWGQPLNKPILGCIAVKKRPGSSWSGHVGFVVGLTKDSVILLGGNQGDKVSVASFKRKEFTAYRWPANIEVPKNPSPLPSSVAGAESNVSQA